MKCHLLTFNPEPGLKSFSVGLDAKMKTAAPHWESDEEEADDEFPGREALMHDATTIKTSLQMQGPFIAAVDRSDKYKRDIREIFIIASKGSLHSHIIFWRADTSHFSFDGGEIQSTKDPLSQNVMTDCLLPFGPKFSTRQACSFMDMMCSKESPCVACASISACE